MRYRTVSDNTTNGQARNRWQLKFCFGPRNPFGGLAIVVLGIVALIGVLSVLRVFGVDTEEEAKRLLVMACETNINGEHIAKELAHEQTIENLEVFSNRLADTWEKMNSK